MESARDEGRGKDRYEKKNKYKRKNYNVQSKRPGAKMREKYAEDQRYEGREKGSEENEEGGRALKRRRKINENK